MKITSLLLPLVISSVAASSKSGKGGKGGKSGGKSGGSGNPCDICVDGRPDSITFKYVPANPSAHQFEKHTCADYMYPSTATISVTDKTGTSRFSGTVNDGDEFTINGPFQADSIFQFLGWTGLDNGGDTCIVHTSCSDELLPGYENRIGPFEIIGDECLPPGDECDICDCGDKKPNNLQLRYDSAGENSLYQPEGKASCRAGMYPAGPTTIQVMDKSGALQETVNVAEGELFTIGEGWDFDSETHFRFTDGTECFIHTSCSVPIIKDDQIGPFEVVDSLVGGVGTDEYCCGPSDPCIKPDKASYTCGEAITVSWDLSIPDPTIGGGPFQPLIDDWVGIYPCNTSPDAYFHAQVWKFNCGIAPPNAANGCTPLVSGTSMFDSLPTCNAAGPHSWPVPSGCWKAVILRNDGPSVPPYVPMCESESFEITGACP